MQVGYVHLTSLLAATVGCQLHAVQPNLGLEKPFVSMCKQRFSASKKPVLVFTKEEAAVLSPARYRPSREQVELVQTHHFVLPFFSQHDKRKTHAAKRLPRRSWASLRYRTRTNGQRKSCSTFWPLFGVVEVKQIGYTPVEPVG